MNFRQEHPGGRVARFDPRFALAVAIVAALGLGPGEDSAEAYRLYDNGATDYIVGSDEALRWSEDAWGPGATLVWEIEDGADWSLLFDAGTNVAPIIEEALAMWSGIETADISWRLSGVANPAEDTSRFGDSRNRVFLERRLSGDRVRYDAGAHIWWVRNPTRSAWEVTECDVGLPWDWWLEGRSEPEDRSRFRRPPPTDLSVRGAGIRPLSRPWPRGLVPGDAAFAHDTERRRRVLASRRRPGRIGGPSWRTVGNPSPWMIGWRRRCYARARDGAATVGSLSGVLESDGTAVPYAHVYAIRQTGIGMREPVGAFANREGAFLIEGLPRGDYILWALPIRNYSSHSRLIQAGAATDVRDALALHPVRVDPGRVTGGITITMRRGRE